MVLYILIINEHKVLQKHLFCVFIGMNPRGRNTLPFKGEKLALVLVPGTCTIFLVIDRLGRRRPNPGLLWGRN